MNTILCPDGTTFTYADDDAPPNVSMHMERGEDKAWKKSVLDDIKAKKPKDPKDPKGGK